MCASLLPRALSLFLLLLSGAPPSYVHMHVWDRRVWCTCMYGIGVCGALVSCAFYKTKSIGWVNVDIERAAQMLAASSHPL